ncbi:MAG: hypothetical protein PWR17_558 [Candidatus Methanomethylophilaceae archaeon]|nr:hypothetical protein [Candidatus Methanomethylophilaceae archaeon]
MVCEGLFENRSAINSSILDINIGTIPEHISGRLPPNTNVLKWISSGTAPIIIFIK